MTSSNLVRELMNDLVLPSHIRFYSVGDQKIFPISGDGGVCLSVIIYLISGDPSDGEIAVQPIEFNRFVDNPDFIRTKLARALDQFATDLVSATCRIVSTDGEDLGRESDKPLV